MNESVGGGNGGSTGERNFKSLVVDLIHISRQVCNGMVT